MPTRRSQPLAGAEVELVAKDGEVAERLPADPAGMTLEGHNILHRAVYRRIVATSAVAGRTRAA